jgi:hypothetical protein
VLAQQSPSNGQADLEGSQAPVIVLLPGKQLLSQTKQSNELPATQQTATVIHMFS